MMSENTQKTIGLLISLVDMTGENDRCPIFLQRALHENI